MNIYIYTLYRILLYLYIPVIVVSLTGGLGLTCPVAATSMRNEKSFMTFNYSICVKRITSTIMTLHIKTIIDITNKDGL